ncbi:hypothetical protein M441DRAFT_68416 [Trichoderma asperellum CBS 433.97]|uniref:Uncharacterized protein n=1 Tax=Trichoderma asperellum (strain ATCC 204424 / CBS 433.97 / NBRC 101777) TaxID=1042311 RepID=A0A2T3Z997_TRIA4|nr:hypothetical protein M441DRAFT_68416 [Trichoderma asperellum CBS 433.97]PTB41384.1 hypothetical protein M441DRAFT_68416 [Trichoderma asperellum CBS 433.97]
MFLNLPLGFIHSASSCRSLPLSKSQRAHRPKSSQPHGTQQMVAADDRCRDAASSRSKDGEHFGIELASRSLRELKEGRREKGEGV